jgi:hypothetical protein
MQRDGPEIVVNPPHNMPLNYQNSDPKSAPKKAPISRLKSTAKPPTATSGRKPPKPKAKAAKKTPKPSGFEWRNNGAGWDLRKVVWVESATSGKQRKRPYLGHLSKSAFGELKRQHRGAALEKVIAEWIAEHDR